MEVIRKKRELAALTQRELARLVGVTEVTIRNYEAGRREPNQSRLKLLATALNCTVADLVAEPKAALVSASELAQAKTELRLLEARIARLKASFPVRWEAQADG